MSLDAPIEQALRSPEPIHALRSLAESLFAHGKDRAAVLAVFEDARRQLREADRGADEDAVLDVMDFLVGWCSPHMSLPPKQPASGGPS